MRALLSCFLSFSGKFIPKVCSLILGEILAVFVKTLAADGKYPAQNCENLQVPIHMQLSQKGKSFSQFFFQFLECTSSFKHFGKKDDCHS